MPNLFSKHLHLCFFKLKYPTILSQPDTQHDHTPSTPPSTLYDSTDDYFSSSSSDFSDSMPDFASVFASQRFFFSSPGSSNSIIESPDTLPCNTNALIPLPRGGVRVPKYSVNPYVDFLHSMQEMIHSRHQVENDWDYLHELLLCYLALNPTHTHKYIVRAFTHLVVDLLSSSSSEVKTTPCRMHNNQRQSSLSGMLL